MLLLLERAQGGARSEEHTSELQSLRHLVCRLLLEKKKNAHRAHARLRIRHASHMLTTRLTSPAPRTALTTRPAWSASMAARPALSCRFFFNDTATTEISTLSLPDALPIYPFREFSTIQDRMNRLFRDSYGDE